MGKKRWNTVNLDLLNLLRNEVSQHYPNLHFRVRNDIVYLSGTIPLVDDGRIVDRFLIEIKFPPHYPRGIPLVYEIGGRIPRTPDRHVYPSGEVCLCLPIQLPEVYPEGTRLLNFLNGPIHSFFFSQSYYEATGKWPFGEWGHGQNGYYEYLSRILDTNDKSVISNYLDVIEKTEIKGHWPCPCNSGKKLRQCHFEQVFKLHKDYNYAKYQYRWKKK